MTADPTARAAALRGLAADGWVPPEPDPADSADALRTDVEAFAEAYWSLPPADRAARWDALWQRAEDKKATGRLWHLQAGLHYDATPHPDADADAVAAAVRELYVLPPRVRAVRRAEWQADRASDPDRWSAAVARLRADRPTVAALEPVLVGRLREDTAFHPVVMASGVGGSSYRPEPYYAPVVPPPPADWRLGGGVVAITVFVIVTLVRLLSVVNSSSTRPSPAYTPPRTYPVTQDPRPDAPSRWPAAGPTFTADEVLSFYKYDPSGLQPMPPRYQEWQRASRPIGRREPPTDWFTPPTGR